jgi:arylformamidase
MILTFELAGTSYRIDTSVPLDISIPLDFGGEQPNAFHLDKAAAHSVDAGSFVGDTRRGGSCNCATVTLNPHGNGTHTECIGHITRERLNVGELLRESLLPCVLVSVGLTRAGDDGVAGDVVVTREALQAAIDALGEISRGHFRGLAIRTLPNDWHKRAGAYSGTNPPYMTLAAMRLVRELGVEHLLIDLPSVDREDDGGALAGHRIFWDAPARGEELPAPVSARTITEMIFVNDSIADGRYLLDLQIPNFMLDAAPSRPQLFRAEAEGS